MISKTRITLWEPLFKHLDRTTRICQCLTYTAEALEETPEHSNRSGHHQEDLYLIHKLVPDPGVSVFRPQDLAYQADLSLSGPYHSLSNIYTTARLAHFGLRPGVDALISHWGFPGSPAAPLATWPTNFTRDIIPLPIHPHNEYWRRVPLFDAIAAGATGVEADIWHRSINGTDDLLVGHKISALTGARSLRSLYLDPLSEILAHQNSNTEFSNETVLRGVFDTNSAVSLKLLIDVKTDANVTLPLLVAQLQPLRDAGYLTTYNETSQKIIPRPITVIGTGNTNFAMIQNFTTPHRDIFFDAPLVSLPSDRDHIYNSTNYLYASGALTKTIGKSNWGAFTKTQIELLGTQVQAAKDRGLLARYWDTPSWPVSSRDSVWSVLEHAGVGMLNVDDLTGAGRRNWSTE